MSKSVPMVESGPMTESVRATRRRIRIAAAAGTVAPLWFWTTLVALAVLHGQIDVSGHQLLRFGFFMYLGFFAFGSLTLVFVWAGLRPVLRHGRRSTAAIILLTIFGCGPLLGTFTMQIQSGQIESGPPTSWNGILHFTGFLLVSLIPILAMPIFGSAVWNDPRWPGFGPLSVAAGVIVAVVVFLPPMPTEGYALWTGPGSMVEIALIGCWQILVSRRAARIAAKETGRIETAPALAADNTSS